MAQISSRVLEGQLRQTSACLWSRQSGDYDIRRTEDYYPPSVTRGRGALRLQRLHPKYNSIDNYNDPNDTTACQRSSDTVNLVQTELALPLSSSCNFYNSPLQLGRTRKHTRPESSFTRLCSL